MPHAGTTFSPASVRRWRRRFATFAAIALACVGLGGTAAPAATPSLRIGVTHASPSLDPWGSPIAVASGEALLSTVAGTLQNQHIMGWGAGNPEPAPGTFDWASLDRRMDLIRRTNGTPVITLCCSPDWMKGGASGTTDWSQLEVAPTRAHFADYADLARRVALRYPEVTRFQVWNEMKGFWDAKQNRWRYEDYTDLYNAVYDAVKSVRPDAQIGGPYVVMEASATVAKSSNPSALRGSWGVVDQRSLDVITYWLAHAHGASFIAIDGSPALSGSLKLTLKQGRDKILAINAWLRSKTSLPIWWSEVYAVPYGRASSYTMQQQVDAWTNAASALQDGGTAVALFWQPESSASWTGLWSSTANLAGGLPTPLFNPLRPWLR
jgi:hypothetical protein